MNQQQPKPYALCHGEDLEVCASCIRNADRHENVDDYQQFIEGYPKQEAKHRLANPVWHIHSGNPPRADMPVTFQMLLTLVSSSNAENAETLWGFIGRYRPGVTPQTHPKLDAMVNYAINYYRDFVAPTKKFREPTEGERAALQDLRDALSSMDAGASAEDIQNVVSLTFFSLLVCFLMAQVFLPAFIILRPLTSRERRSKLW